MGEQKESSRRAQGACCAAVRARVLAAVGLDYSGRPRQQLLAMFEPWARNYVYKGSKEKPCLKNASCKEKERKVGTVLEQLQTTRTLACGKFFDSQNNLAKLYLSRNIVTNSRNLLQDNFPVSSSRCYKLPICLCPTCVLCRDRKSMNRAKLPPNKETLLNVLLRAAAGWPARQG